VTLLLCAPAGAQSRKWQDPYDKGTKAFAKGNYSEAVKQLERAVEIEPKAGMKIEGAFRDEYFPYYYLALAYIELGEFQKARVNLDKARVTVQKPQQARLAAAEAKINTALAPPPANTPPPVPPRAETPVAKPDPPPPARNAAFDEGVREAESLINGRQYDAAIKKFDQLRGIDAAEYGKLGLAGRRDEAVKGYAARLTDDARTALQASKFRDAQAKLREADQLLPGQKAVADLQAEIRRRDDEYKGLRSGAEADFAAKNYAGAVDKLRRAQTVQPEQFAADRLAPRYAEARMMAENTTPPPPVKPPAPPPGPPQNVIDGQQFVEQAKNYLARRQFKDADANFASALRSDPANQEASAGLERSRKFKQFRDEAARLRQADNTAAAQKALIDARNADAARFDAEGLTAVLNTLTESKGEDTFKLALRDGLLALLNGDADKCAAILEPAVSGGGKSAPLHAYLGVAYATQALTAARTEDRSRLRSRAVEQFSLAKSAEPGYRLSPRIVAPTILAIYQDARR
jgi:tetratricopeptide (TPR) repeat protein